MTLRSSYVLWPRMFVKYPADGVDTLRRFTHLRSFAFALLCLLLSAHFAVAGSSGNGSQRGGTDHYYCTSNDPGQITIYFSAEFDFSWAPGTVRVQDSVIGNEFKQILAAKYGYHGSVVCFGTKTTAQTQTQLQNSISGARSSGKWKVVETGWKWSGATAGGGAASGSDQTPAQTEASGSAGSSGGSGNSSGNSSGSSAGNGSAQAASAGADSGGQAESAPAAGTTVAVRMAEAVDSSRDASGKKYRGLVTKAVDAGNGTTIPAGSVAMVTLIKGQDGWSAHLQSVMVKGQAVNVTSAPASVMGSAQSSVANAANSVTSAIGSFGGFGHHNRPDAVAAVATGDRVLLPPGTQLQFVLSGGGASSGGGTASSGASNMGGVNHPGTASAPAMAASPGNLTAKVTETLLGPRKQEGLFVVSPDGGHYAVSAMHGSRELIIIDGVDGPQFDHAAHGWGGQTVDFVFSSDGKHSAYVAQSGDEMVEVRDGKTAFTITSVTPGANGAQNGSVQPIDQSRIHNPDSPTNSLVHQCVISPSGAHVAVVSSGAGGYFLFLDGVKSPPYRTINLSQIAFVAEKLVYAAQTNDGKWHMVVNDKPGPAYDGLLTFLVNDDNSHYAFVYASAAAIGSLQGVAADGVPGTTHRGQIRNMTIASNGRVAYAAVVGGTPGSPNGSNDLYLDDRDIGPVVQPFAVADPSGKTGGSQAYVLFSPDGKRFAYVKRVPGGMAAVVDGKVGRAYDSIGAFQFSPDSKHDFYVGNRTLAFVVVDGQEMDGQGTVRNFVYSKEGGRLGYEAYSAQTGFHVVVDGKESPVFHEIMANALAFSPDGKHYTYSACTNFSVCQMIVDGESKSIPSLIPFTTRARPPIDFPPVFFSQDGTRMAYGYPKSDGTSGNVIVINGQEIMHGHGTYEFPGFSPDSKHFATMFWTGHAYSLFVDGKSGAPYEDFLEVNRNVAKFEDAHTFRFLGVKNGMVYRVVVDLGG